MNKQFCRLWNSISSTIYEGAIKLGYEPDTSMSIYYDLGLVNYLLASEYKTPETCLQALKPFIAEVNISEEHLIVQLAKKRFQFTVTGKGVEQVLKQYENKPFLKEIIELARNHHFSIEDVKEIFHKYDPDYVMEETDTEEFQYVFFFKDKAIDEYMYCFNLQDCYYHRLLPYDYERL